MTDALVGWLPDDFLGGEDTLCSKKIRECSLYYDRDCIPMYQKSDSFVKI